MGGAEVADVLPCGGEGVLEGEGDVLFEKADAVLTAVVLFGVEAVGEAEIAEREFLLRQGEVALGGAVAVLPAVSLTVALML